MNLDDLTDNEREFFAYKAAIQSADQLDFRYFGDIPWGERMKVARRWKEIAVAFSPSYADHVWDVDSDWAAVIAPDQTQKRRYP